MEKNNLAAIDLGTNSCRLYITDKNGDKLYREGQNIMLGEEMSKNMCFTSVAMERGLHCLAMYRELMNNYQVKHYRAVATASCRMAKNSTEFLTLAQEMCDIDLEVISPQEEAFLTLKGACLNADPHKKYILVYDLGGGSTEITLATNGQQPQIIYTLSIPLGARNSAEIFDLSEYDKQRADDLRNKIKQYTQKFIKESNFMSYLPDCSCLATSGTPLRLAAMILQNRTYDREQVDGVTLDVKRIDEQIQWIQHSNLLSLSENKYIGSKRAPIFTAASVIFQTIYQELHLSQLTASLKGAQEAIIEDLIQKWQN